MPHPQREGWKQAEAELFRLLVENVKDYAVFVINPQGRVQTWNPGAERLLGYREDEIIGQPADLFFAPEDVRAGVPQREMREALESGRGNDDRWHVRKDGSRFWSGGMMTPLRDEAGNLRGFAKIMRDRTEWKRQEEALKESEERHRAIADLTSDFATVCRVDEDGSITVESVTQGFQKATGYSLEEMNAQGGWPIVVHPDDMPVVQQSIRHWLAGKDHSNEIRIVTKRGETRWLNYLGRSAYDPRQGRVTRLFTAAQDTTERKRADEALAERVRLLALGAEVGTALGQGDTLRDALQRCAEAMVKHLHGAFARIWTLDEAGGVLELQASAGMYTHLDGPHGRVPVGRYKIGLIAQERKPHLTNGVVGDPRVPEQEWARREGMVAFAGYPLLVEDRLVGVMAMFARHPLTEATLQAMASVANGIALGVERKRADARLREQREWLAVTLASIGDAVITTDTEGRVTFLNGVAEQLTGWAQADAQGRPLEAVFHILNEQTRRPVENPVQKVLREGAIVGLANHTVLIDRHGTERPIDDSAAPIRNGAGTLIGVVLVFRDVAEQRRAENRVRQGEARKTAILETALDCIVTMDHHGNVAEFNPAAEKTFGYRREQVVGRPLADFIIPPPLRERHYRGLAHYLATGEGPVLGRRLELTALRADGTEFPVELAITRIPTEGPPLFTAYLRDITERRRAEQHRSARLAVTHALAQAASAEEGVGGVLQAVCESLAWEVGFFWTVDGDGESLVCRQSWHRADAPVRGFEANTFSRTFRRGEGLPGHVWSTGRPRWLLDVVRDANFPRAASAAEYGLRSAFACPVTVNDRILGVIEFFTQRLREPDADLLEMMGTVAGNVGQFIERKQAEEKLRRSERELADFFENATIGLHWVGADGTILRANRAELELLGYAPEEYVGHNIADFHADEDVICDILQRLQAKEKLHDYPARMRCKDGSVKDVLIHSSVLFEDGRFVHTRCFTRDVTEQRKSEAALREAERRFRAVFDQQFQFMAILAPDGTVLEANETCFRATGVGRERVLGRLFWETPWWDRLPAMQGQWRRFVSEAAGGGRVTGEAEYLLADGTTRLATVVVTGLEDESGRVTSVVVEGRDDTERKQQEAALRQSEERFRQLAENIEDVFWMADPRTPQVLFISPAYERVWGRSRQSLYDQPRSFLEAVHPDDRQRVVASLGRQAAGEATSEEYRVVRPDGSVRWVWDRAFPIRDQAGDVYRVAGIAEDITEHRHADELSRFLADASATLATVVDYESTLQKVAGLAVPAFADWCAVDLVVAGGSLRRLAVVHVEAEKVRLASELYHKYPPDPGEAHGAYRVLRTGEPEFVAEIGDDVLAEVARDEEHLRILRGLGLKSFMCVPLRSRSRMLGVLTFVYAESGRRYEARDLSLAVELARRAAIAIENASLYQELREADRRKDEFLATLAHELRNPLAPIRNGLQVLRLAGPENGVAAEARSMMERQLSQMVRLVDDLLDVSRITRNKLELRRQRVELAAVVHSAVETSRPLIEQAGHTFSLTLPPVPVYLDADLTRLAQVFSNLLNNSAKYTEPGGHISLTGEVAGGEAVVRVRDNGLGIPAEALPRLFQMFSQVDRNLERAQGGLGIGLTLVRRLTEMHGGSVEARSEGPGRGSEFIVRLPVFKGVPRRSDDPAAGAGTEAGPRRRILVVDDNQDSAMSLGMMLKLLNNETRMAHDGLAAVEVAQEFRPDLILLDIGLPKLNGYDACRRIREQPWSEGVVIVALTGWGQEEDRRRSHEAGFDHHLVKPVELAALQAILQNAPSW